MWFFLKVSLEVYKFFRFNLCGCESVLLSVVENPFAQAHLSSMMIHLLYPTSFECTFFKVILFKLLSIKTFIFLTFQAAIQKKIYRDIRDTELCLSTHFKSPSWSQCISAGSFGTTRWQRVSMVFAHLMLIYTSVSKCSLFIRSW